MKAIWTVHLATLLALTAWSAIDPVFETIFQMRSLAHAFSYIGWLRIAAFISVLGVAFASLLVLFMRVLGLARGTSNQRSVGQLLGIKTVIALWCSLAIHHDAIAWQGKRARFVFRVHEL